jgi:hypothetical protein
MEWRWSECVQIYLHCPGTLHRNCSDFAPGDVILRQGFYGRELYFVARGSVEVRVYFHQLHVTLMHNRGLRCTLEKV